jgi:hypothetical protein
MGEIDAKPLAIRGAAGATLAPAELVVAIPPSFRALDAARSALTGAAVDALLSTTGPLAEWNAAKANSILDEAMRSLIARKGSGVVFEGLTLASLQDASVRRGVELTARLSGTTNAPRADITVLARDGGIDLQLKTGADRYIRSAIRNREEGVRLLVPRDVTANEWAQDAWSFVEVDGVVVDTPTRGEILAHSERALDRLSNGESSFSMMDVADAATTNSLVDGLTAVVIDLCLQSLSTPNVTIDWNRAGRVLAKATATSATATFISGVMTRSMLAQAGRSIDGTANMRAAQVAWWALPKALNVISDLAKKSDGVISDDEFKRRLSRELGAATAELLAFRHLARLASQFGPFGSALVMLVGNWAVSWIGASLGELVYEFSSTSSAGLPAPETAQDSPQRLVGLEGAARLLLEKMSYEQTRRIARAKARQCEQPGCRRRHHARGMCGRHYMRWWRQTRYHRHRARSPV